MKSIIDLKRREKQIPQKKSCGNFLWSKKKLGQKRKLKNNKVNTY